MDLWAKQDVVHMPTHTKTHVKHVQAFVRNHMEMLILEPLIM